MGIESERAETQGMPLSMLVALPSSIILSIVAAFVCWFKTRQDSAPQFSRAESLPSASASTLPERRRSSAAGRLQQDRR